MNELILDGNNIDEISQKYLEMSDTRSNDLKTGKLKIMKEHMLDNIDLDGNASSNKYVKINNTKLNDMNQNKIKSNELEITINRTTDKNGNGNEHERMKCEQCHANTKNVVTAMWSLTVVVCALIGIVVTGIVMKLESCN